MKIKKAVKTADLKGGIWAAVKLLWVFFSLFLLWLVILCYVVLFSKLFSSVWMFGVVLIVEVVPIK